MLLAWVRGIVEGVETFAVGMASTARFAYENWSGSERGAMTREYPAEKVDLPERFRGHLFNDVDKCITCKLCLKACPVDCFVIDGERTEDNKLRPSRFDIDLTKCIYCGLCTRACPTDCLTMEGGFELDPRNTVNQRGERFLFTQRPDQIDARLEGPDMVRLAEVAGKPAGQLSADDRAFLDRIEDPRGNTITAKFGVGYYTAEEAKAVEARREELKKAKEAKAAADKAAAEAAKAAAAAKAADVPAAKPEEPTP